MSIRVDPWNYRYFRILCVDYTVLGTIAVTKPLKGYPMVDILPIADSKLNESSSGDINFLLQKSNPLFANIKKKNEISAIFSNQTQSFDNATSTFQSAGYKVIITGYVAQVTMEFALNDLLLLIQIAITRVSSQTQITHSMMT